MGVRNHGGQGSSQITLLAVDPNAHAEFEPVDAAALQFRVNVIDGVDRPVGKIVIDSDFEPLLLERVDTTPEKIEPLPGAGEGQVAIERAVRIRTIRSNRKGTELTNVLDRFAFVRTL